ncbi:MAG: DUF4192 domain-containing protein [Streptosporangiaceae bacterium]|jgi:hypothetical protein
MTQALAAGDDTPLSSPTSGSRPDPSRPDPSRPDPEPSPVQLRADSPEALLAIVPYLLGFMPRTSLVLIGTERPGDRIKVTLRYDLPDPPGAGIAADLAAHAVGVLSSQQLTALVAVGYGSRALVDPVAEALRAAAGSAGIHVGDILRVDGRRYWSYICTEEACCPTAGTPFAVDSRVAFALAGTGGEVLADRTAVAARVAPLGGIAAESMRQATRRAQRHVRHLLARVRKSARLGAARQMIAAEGLSAVGAMIGTYRAGGRFASDYQVAWITVALRDLRVRDDAWARMDPEHAEAHLRLWTDVTRRAQPGYVAAPASLLAFVAWQSGDGALANVALDRALADEPRYSMAQLLRQVITAGTPPSLARLPMTPEEVAASYADADADADAELDEDDDGPDPDVHAPDPAYEP